MSLDKLAEISRFYGSNPEYVLAGGGNTSFKNEDILFVKASGTSLAEATIESFVKMDRKALSMIWEKTYPQSSEKREKEVLADLMSARKPTEEQKRPSVEALLHDIIPFPFVVHLHPALVNGLCCSQKGEETAKEIFGDDMLWIPSINPGYVLSCYVKDAMSEYFSKHNKHVQIILLQNHGVFVGGQCENCINSIYNDVMSKIGARIKRKPDFSDEIKILSTKDFTRRHVEPAVRGAENAELGFESTSMHPDFFEKISLVNNILRDLSGVHSMFMHGSEISSFVKDQSSFYPISSAFTPDHIVYSGSDPLFIDTDTETTDTETVIKNEWDKHTQKTGRNPKIIAVKDLGIFSAAATEKAAVLALDLFKDTIKVAIYSESFGGPLFMTTDKIDFINNWEVERFRSSVSIK